MRKEKLTKEEKLQIDKEIQLLAEDKLKQSEEILDALMWAAAYTGRWYTILSADFLDSGNIKKSKKCSLIALHCDRVYNKLHNIYRHQRERDKINRI